MTRQVGQHIPPGCFFTNIEDNHHGNCAFIDGQFLHFFLLYLNHNKLKMNSDAATDIALMKWLLTLQCISHRETCYNVLGCVYKEQGNTVRAIECFKKSIEEKPFCNAAFWHVAFWCIGNIA